MDNDLHYEIIKPHKPLSDFVDSFWFLHNQSDSNKETTGLPDGRVDLFLFQSPTEPFRIALLGLGTAQHESAVIPANGLMFSISFKLLAIEYIFHDTISDIVNNGKLLPEGFWGFTKDDLQDFDLFVEKATKKIQSLLPKDIDKRKLKLFELIYVGKGAVTVKELSEKVFWSSRQINRYFNQQFGISLKTYCNILRFRASLEHIAQGKLFPEENFTDQNHFIKEIKKFSGVVPKELFKNKNDRFILLSTLPRK
ncbi:helix-turn-helix domain-containing protein [Pedobacter heparinus]|uniref:Helix-turn-helix-domain containing protein AraC type n=1 Tax=Pedobacter heparinus (strain ATCC 13125 / DSM 2366 / CIP 104194 / JCM 7457 / NBRC 12017 / NCIMB 9290 / NRRL B-14731 / HIM 762-3) TaxID=485917 RepID=C6XSE9_PEDHD|nr:AraC family transcriptional regulator [Pedobacter heparinus]ACU03494.1 helix-turn-helix- domain containing protein AraC type [Pedobacter heparinus DSM 2366]